MLDTLLNLVERLGPWGYLVVFLVVMLECQALLGLFMPGESLVVAGGFLAARGMLDRTDLIVVVALAAILGDSISYELGRHLLKREWLLKPRRRLRLRPQQLARVENFFNRHGRAAVFAGHFLHVMRALMPFVAGMARMPYARFLPFNAAGCVVWATVFVLVGYYAGPGWSLMAGRIGRIATAVVVALLLVAGLLWAIGRFRRRTRE